MDLIIVTGPPGSGKGTQSKELAAKKGYVHISTGDLLRERMQVDDELGRHIKGIMDANDFISDEIMWTLLEERLQQEPQNATVLLDGFPRTEEQARIFDEKITGSAYKLKGMIGLDVPDEVLVDRIKARGRNEIDRDEAQIQKRLDDYKSKTIPVIEHYADKGLFVSVDGNDGIDEVTENIENALSKPPFAYKPRPPQYFP